MNKSKAAEFVIRNVRTEAKPREQKEAIVLHRIHLNKSERLVAFDEIDAIFSALHHLVLTAGGIWMWPTLP